MNCVYTLEVPQDYRMEVTFQNFSMPPKTSGRECDTDYVIIKDGESEGRGRLIGRFCGHERPKSFLSSGRFVWINFVTDDVQSQYAGFKVNFRPIHEGTIDSSCCQKHPQPFRHPNSRYVEAAAVSSSGMT